MLVSRSDAKFAAVAIVAAVASTIGVGFANAGPGPVTDVQVTVSGPSAAAGGADFAFVTVVDNNGPADADGATLTINAPAGSADLAVTCAPLSSAAVCPSLSISGSTVSGVIPTLTFNTATGTGGGLSITVTGRFPSPGAASLGTSALVTLPSGVSDSNPSSNTTNINTVMDYRVDVGVVKTVAPTAIVAGQPVVYTLAFTNNGPSSADGLELGDNLSTSGTASSIYETFDSVFLDCVVTGGAECPAVYADQSGRIGSTNPLGATFLRFPPGATITLRYEVTFNQYPAEQCGSSTSGVLRNTAFIYGRTDTNSANDTSAANITTPDIPDCVQLDLQTTKTADEQSVDIGADEPINFTVTFTNAGPGDAPGAQITDYLTSQFASGINISNMNCVASPGVTCPVLSPMGWTVFDTPVGPWAAGATLTITYTAVLIPKSADEMPVCADQFNSVGRNQSSIWPINPGVDTDQSNNVAVYTFAVTGGPEDCVSGDLSIVKTFLGDPTSTDPTRALPFTLVITNEGDTDATNVRVTDQLSGTSLWSGVTQVLTFGSCAVTGSATCPSGLTDRVTSLNDFALFAGVIDVLPAGSTVTIPYEVTFNVDLSLVCSMQEFGLYNSSDVSPGPAFSELNWANNQSAVGFDSAIENGSTCTDVAIIKTVEPTTAAVGDTVTYTLRVSNAGLMPADSVAVRDALPSFFSHTSSSCVAAVGSPVCGPIDVTSNVLTLTLPLLEPGDSVDINIVGVAVGAPGTFSNTATALGTTGVSRYIETEILTNSSQVNAQILPPAVTTTTDPNVDESTTTTTEVGSDPVLTTTTTTPSTTTPQSQPVVTSTQPAFVPDVLPTTGSSPGSAATLALATCAFGTLMLFAVRRGRRTSCPR